MRKNRGNSVANLSLRAVAIYLWGVTLGCNDYTRRPSSPLLPDRRPLPPAPATPPSAPCRRWPTAWLQGTLPSAMVWGVAAGAAARQPPRDGIWPCGARGGGGLMQ